MCVVDVCFLYGGGYMVHTSGGGRPGAACGRGLSVCDV